MGAVADDRPVPVSRSVSRSGSETRSNKVVKRSRDKKQAKSIDLDAVLEAAENTSPTSDDTQDERDKKSQGVIIDGRTYTCATCKAGHRVGICKHGRERPMTATHPPGRPPAGAPKKIICDCPRQCNCKKRDCKCARNCNCTQSMYMLVYLPAPGEDESTNEEKGKWKLGEQVTTDLKGNVLTPEQVRERLEQKEAQKLMTPERRGTGPTINSALPHMSASPTAEPKPKELGGCCKHKENVATRGVAAELAPGSGSSLKVATDGCNCGSTCACAFCPQHPNNSTSLNMARQQAMHFANQPYNEDLESIVPFMPTLPQGASCMGGLPQFAISRYSERPSFHDLQRTFPYPGYVIGYPIWSTRTDNAGYPMAPFPMQPHFVSDMNMMGNEGLDDLPRPVSDQLMTSVQTELPPLDFSQDEFGIGSAFVASAGPGGWNENILSPNNNMWSMESSVTTPIVNEFIDTDYLTHATRHTDLNATPLPHSTPFDISSTLDAANTPHFFNVDNASRPTPDLWTTQQPTISRRSCCTTLMDPGPSSMEPHLYASSHLSPAQENVPKTSFQP